MPIKTTLESLDNVPEGLHEFYKETDGGYVLDVEGIDAHPDVSNLRNAYQRVKESDKAVRAELQELKRKADSIPEDFDPDLWKKAASGELEQGLVKVRKELEQELAATKEKAATFEQQIRRMTVDSTLESALSAANITEPAFRKAATVILRDAVKLDGDKVVVESDMGPLDAAEYVKKWAASDEGRPFVSQPSGGGSKSGNPNVMKAPKSWDEAKTKEEKLEVIRSKLSAQR